MFNNIWKAKSTFNFNRKRHLKGSRKDVWTPETPHLVYGQPYWIIDDMRLYTSVYGWLKKNIVFYRLENYSYNPLSGMYIFIRSFAVFVLVNNSFFPLVFSMEIVTTQNVRYKLFFFLQKVMRCTWIIMKTEKTICFCFQRVKYFQFLLAIK